MKLKLVIEAEFEVKSPIDTTVWPNCKTIHDVAKLETEYYNDGKTSLEDLLSVCKINSVNIKGIE